MDVMRSFGLPNTAMASGFLGSLGTGRWGKVTVHCQTVDDVLHSYTAWVPTELIDDSPSKGLTVQATLYAKVLPTERVWICNSFAVLG